MGITTVPLLSGSIIERQIESEERAVADGISRYRKLAQQAIDRGDGSSLKPAERLLVHWMGPIAHLIRQEQIACKAGKYGQNRAIYGPVIQAIGPKKIALIVMREAINACMIKPNGMVLVKLAYAVGSAVLSEIHTKLLRRLKPEGDQESQPWAVLTAKFKRLTPVRVNWWAKRHLDEPITERKVCVTLGVRLLEILMDGAWASSYEDLRVPAFTHDVRPERFGKTGRPRTVGYVSMTDACAAITDDGHASRQLLRPRYRPMLVRPYPCQPNGEGGYAKVRTPFIIKPTPDQKKALAEADLSEMLSCLDAVNSTAWRVNLNVAMVQDAFWKAGGGVLEIPPRDPRPMPPEVESDDPEIVKEAKRERSKVYKQNIADRAERIGYLSRDELVRSLNPFPEFYLPHQFDYRGRCYPIPQHLNHHGSDVPRGILEFATGVKLDDEGRRWLMIHAANCWATGDVDKLPFEGRIAWAREHAAKIRAVAADPMASDWWHDAKTPWQFLAACFAIADPEAAAHLPIQHDGTCNGLQHYAALGRDEAGAAAVNMIPSDVPVNTYSLVLNAVQDQLKIDSTSDRRISYTVHEESGKTKAEIAIADLAKMLAPITDRDTVKVTAMTKLYDVTIVGARQQMRSKLKKAGLKGKELYFASAYLANLTLDAVGKVCVSAEQIMDWLRACSRIIVDSGEPVRWKTPLGLPVVQPYRNFTKYQVRTNLQSVAIMGMDDTAPIKGRKHVSAFAPNFIHSLDAAHLLRTAKACSAAGVAFAGVHDSYWTHAQTSTQMSSILREEFVRLHSQPLLWDLYEQFTNSYPMVKFPKPPIQGKYELRLVLDSPYFFS